MNQPTRSCEITRLVSLVNTMTAYWKAIAEKNFNDTYPNSDPEAFQRVWPKTLDNIFLAETVRTAKLLSSLPTEGRDN